MLSGLISYKPALVFNAVLAAPSFRGAKSVPAAKKKKTLKTVLAGPPASGKGTQCDLISKTYGVTHISTGDLLRKEIKELTPLGKKVKPYTTSGLLVPDSLIIELVSNVLQTEPCLSKGWLLDGFPRTPEQAKKLVKLKLLPDHVIVLDIPDDTAVQRSIGRRIDPVTNAVYNVDFSMPKDPAVLARLIQRDDDTEAKMRVRLKLYHEALAATSVFKKAGVSIHHVNALQHRDTVFSEIRKILDL
ncbi:adenylate kinase, mitochondrial [Pelomyxa schiedti]|nr:adenylate kinase, mitochondrial [Pelomyxa schiedti]